MNNKLIISHYHKGILLGFLFEDDNLIRIKSLETDSLVGNIYCGYVKDVVKNLNACFVEFDDNKKGFLTMKEAQNFKSGNKILVQVTADKIKTKDYALTTDISLNGKYLVLTEGNKNISISKKISNKELRNSLKEKLSVYPNEEFGFILRTNGANVTIEELNQDAEKLIALRNGIYRRLEHSSPKACLLDKGTVKDIVEQFIDKYNCQVITDHAETYEQIKDIEGVSFNQDNKVSLCNKYSLDKYLRQALGKQVWLKSGAYLVIEPTEALTVIDVNTGKAEVRTNRESTFKKINLEAAKEVLRQIQIRNLSGIIIVDFINMADQENYIELKKHMEELAIYDYSKCFVVGFTKLGLLEISRKKSEKPLHQIINEKELYEEDK